MISRFAKSCLIVAADITLLMVLPYMVDMRNELESLRSEQTHPALPSDSSTNPVVENITPEPETARTPRRPILLPTVPVAAVPTAVDEDPFLMEARRRAQDDPEAAMQWLQAEASGQDRLRGMLEVVALWAAEDSATALLWLESNAQGLARLETLNSGVELWSQQDPSAAAAWIDGMANDGSKVTAAKALAANWGNQNPAEASQWVEQLPAGSLRDEASSALIESWATNAPEAAAIWALTQAEFNGNKDLLNLSIEQYTQVSPQDAEAFVRSVNDAYDAPEAIETYVKALAQNSPIEAMNWQTSLKTDDPLYSPKNTSVIMEEWSRIDSVSASTWLNDTRPGPERDAAIIGFTTTMLDFDPEAAAAWSNSISETNQRIKQLNETILSWAHTQPHEALEWVKQAAIEPDLKHALASQIGAD